MTARIKEAKRVRLSSAIWAIVFAVMALICQVFHWSTIWVASYLIMAYLASFTSRIASILATEDPK